jgi:cytochrome c-type biogenesis protein CcmE
VARPSPVRLVIALSVAAVLAIFMLYFVFAGGTPSVRPSQLKEGREVALVGKVVGAPRGDSYAEQGLRFQLQDVKGSASVPVVYRGSVPDQFKTGRELRLHGRLQSGVFVAKKDSMRTKCPSKYTAKEES